jgi:hypothetical protein
VQPIPGYLGLLNPGIEPRAPGFPVPSITPAPGARQAGPGHPRLKLTRLQEVESLASLPSLVLDAEDAEDTAHDLSADPHSDSHLQALIREFSQKGKAVRQSGQQSADAPF